MKLRFWIKEQGRFVFSRHFKMSSFFDSYEFYSNIFNRPLERAIGLKDKTGKDIFEGDIVKWDDMSNGKYWRVAVVEIRPDIQFRCIEYPSIPNHSAVDKVFRFGAFAYQDTENHLEVIGNIHQSKTP